MLHKAVNLASGAFNSHTSPHIDPGSANLLAGVFFLEATLRSPYLCRCGCGDNVEQSGVFAPGHERPSVARKYREEKQERLDAIREDKAAQVQLPPHYGRGAGQPVHEEEKRPEGPIPHFGRGDR